jgi:hypothetical protein
MRMSILAVNRDKFHTIEIANTELFRYLNEIRPANKAYSDLLSEGA